MGPTEATLTEAEQHLLGHHAEVTTALLRGEYAPWLGSGISRERAPDLHVLLRRLVELLAARADNTNPLCPFTAALREAERIAGVPCGDFAAPSTQFIDSLVGKYSAVLSIPVRAHPPVSIAFDILRLPEEYSRADLVPDAEHAFVALLIAEGIFRDVVTTNWDPLVERACARSKALDTPALHVVVKSAEVAGSATSARLLKLHGCAELAAKDPSYRPYFIATQTQISRWSAEPQWSALGDLVRTIARERPLLFVGLSGQDSDIQLQIAHVLLGREHWGVGGSPRAVFAVGTLDQPQRAILELLHGEDVFLGVAGADIESRATIGLYAKPLLGALYFLTVRRKLEVILNAGASERPPPINAFLAGAFSQTLEALRQRFDGVLDPSERWRSLARDLSRWVSHFFSLYRVQTSLPPGVYYPISRVPAHEMEADPLTASRGEWAALLCLAAIREGAALGYWNAVFEWPSVGQFTLSIQGRTLTGFIIRDGPRGLARLVAGSQQPSEDDPEWLVLFSNDSRPARQRRGPGRALPSREVDQRTLHAWVLDVLTESSTPEELISSLKLELVGAGLHAI